MSDNLPPLMPCPFCGGPASIRGDFGLQQLGCADQTCECAGADIALPCYRPELRSASIKRWNARAAIDASRAAVPAGWWSPSKEQFAAWRRRHDMREMDRPAFDDAASLYMLSFAAIGAPQPVAQPGEALAPANNYIQSVPDHCDRIVWRGHYHHLPVAQAKPEQAAQQWHPIETAPAGATGYAWMMLAWGPEDDQNTGVGMRDGDKFYASATFYRLGREKQYEFREIEVRPTHWMPLPASPQPKD